MGAVEHPELHQLEGGHVVDELDSDRAEIGAGAIDEAVLDHPLAERLVHHRRAVEAAGEGGEAVDVLGLGGRHDAVDHGGGKGAFGLDPVGEGGIDQAGELQRDAAHDAAVLRQVVAAEDGEGAVALGAATLERADEEARRRAGCVGVGEVVGDVRVSAVEASGRGLVAVALLGDGERDDADGGIGHGGEDDARILAGDEDVLHRLDDAGGLALRAELERGVGEVLGREEVALGRRHQADAEDAPVAAGFRHRIGDVDRAVGAEEGAEAEVDDTEATAVGGTAAEAGRVSGQANLRYCGQARCRPLAARCARRCARGSCWARACARAPAGRSPPPHPRHCSPGFLGEKTRKKVEGRPTPCLCAGLATIRPQRASQPPSTGRIAPWM